MIKTVKDTPPGFLSHDLPSRKSGKGRFFDSLQTVKKFVLFQFEYRGIDLTVSPLQHAVGRV